MVDLKLYLLGAPYLEVDGRMVEIQRRKVLALLSYLALTGQPQRRDTLATLLWPDAGQSQARAALGRNLSELRTLIGAAHVQANRETVALVGTLWLDVKHFQQLITTFDRKDPASATSLSQAITLYRDDFLTGFTLPDCPDFDEWQFFQSDGLRQEFATALTQLVITLCEQGDYAAALPHARRRLALDTLDEAAHCQVMELYARTSQLSAALRQYELCVQTLEDEFGAPPAAETTVLYKRIRAGEFGRGAGQQESRATSTAQPTETVLPAAPEPIVNLKSEIVNRHNLPPQPTPFIGRAVELTEVARLLAEAEGRLVTIVGPGGMGKTRLALAVAEAQVTAARFADSVFFVPLAPLSDVAHIVPAIAEALSYPLEAEGQSGQSAQTQLLHHLRERQLLLVLDNFEHLLAGVEVVAAILQAAPRVQVLATSRERLHLHGEQLFPIQGLGFPDWETPGDAATYTAVQLFIQSARRIQPHFALAAADLTHLTRICRLVEGMPLGIELAAGWVDLLSLPAIVAEIQRSLDFLATEARNVPDRQRSMRAVFDHSWERLNEAEQQTFARFAVFRGGFTRQAAQEVTAASLRLLSALVSKSLLHYEPATARYQIHELLRQYAAEKLETAGQTATVRDAHAAYFAGFLQQQEADLKGEGYRQAKAAIAADFENVRQGWRWAVERRAYATLERAMEGLYWFLRQDLQRYQAGQALFHSGREALAPTGNEAPHPLWGKMLARVLPYGPGDFEQPAQVKAWLEQAQAIAEAHGDAAEVAFCRWLLPQVQIILGDFAPALDELERCLHYYRAVGDRFYSAWTLEVMAKVHNRLGRQEQGVACRQECLRLFRELGTPESQVLFGLALTLGGLGDFAEAEAQLHRAYQLSQADSNPGEMAAAKVYLSRVLSLKGDFAEAHRAALEGLAISTEHNLEYRQLQARIGLGMRAYERGDWAEAFTYLSQVQDRATLDIEQIQIEIVLGLTISELGIEQVRPYLVKRLQGPLTLALYNLPLAALLCQQTDRLERAATLLALFTKHALPTWQGSLYIVIRKSPNALALLTLQETLAAALPPDHFAAAWARGEALDLATTIAALAEEFVQSDWPVH